MAIYQGNNKVSGDIAPDTAVIAKRAFGNIGFSVDYQFDVFVNLVGIRYPNGLWEISFFGRIDENTAPNDFYNFNQGFSINHIKTMLDINPNLQFMFSKSAKMYTNSMQVIRAFESDEDCFQYGGLLLHSGTAANLLCYARFYTSLGWEGGWAPAIQDLYKKGNYIEATICFQEV